MLVEPSKPSELLKNALRPCSALLPQMIKPRESQFHRYFDLDVLYTHDSAMTELKNLGECKDGTNIVRYVFALLYDRSLSWFSDV